MTEIDLKNLPLTVEATTLGMSDEHESLFWEMMTNPGSKLYQKCYARMSEFDKKLRKIGNVFEHSMRKAFLEVVQEENIS